MLIPLSLIMAITAATGWLAFHVGHVASAWISLGAMVVTLGWFLYELRNATYVVTIVAPERIEREVDARIEHEARTQRGATRTTAVLRIAERRPRGGWRYESILETVEVRDGHLCVETDAARAGPGTEAASWLEIRVPIAFGPDLRLRVPVEVVDRA